MLDPTLRDTLQHRLDESRAELLAALEGVTEQDFGTDLGGGQTVVLALAALAEAERRENAEVRGESTEPPAAKTRPLPPQVVHALAGASYRSRRYLESEDADTSSARALVDGVVERETSLAERIRNRPPATPPPVFPVI